MFYSRFKSKNNLISKNTTNNGLIKLTRLLRPQQKFTAAAVTLWQPENIRDYVSTSR